MGSWLLPRLRLPYLELPRLYLIGISSLFRVLAEFQTRKARRVHIRDKDLLKYWITCLLISVIYLAAWSGVNVNYTQEQGVQLVVTISPSQGGSQQQCVVTGWDYVTKCSKQ